ncbi:MAG: AAA family ATPase [Thermoguttaceae bacterium]|nr:AAA family ATPase [Thermoguttaceae bacterium]
MKISSLKIERFGVWEDLNLPKISGGINVFFGPNEAGKTTLMQFIRTCLYGGGDEDRARYIQMALDGRKRRERVGADLDAFRNDPRRTDPNAASLDERSDVPPELRRFLNRAPKSGPEVVSSDPKDAAKTAARVWIGGSATLTSDFGEHKLERRYVRRDASYQSAVERKAGFVVSDGLLNWSGRFYSLPGQKIAESLIVIGPDGTRVGDYLAKSLTCNLDESTYNGVFAIGLDELQKLGMLNETEAAQMLYRLSVGVDRGAFVQVFQQIVSERNDLLDQKGRPSILENLLSERDRSRRNASETASDLRECARLLEERRAVLEAANALQERLDKAKLQKKLRELALQIAPTWDERAAARLALDEMGTVPKIERPAYDRAKELADVANQTRLKIRELKKAFLAKRDERAAVEIDPVLDELVARVAILEDDLPRLNEIDAQVAKLRERLAELTVKLNEEDVRLRGARDGKIMLTPSAMEAINASIVAENMAPEAVLANRDKNRKNGETSEIVLPNKLLEDGVPFKEVEDFKIPAKAMRKRRLRLMKYRDELNSVSAKLSELVEKLERGLTSRQQKNLTEAIEKTGALVAGLRRRIEIDRRVVEMTSYRKELERQNKVFAENQAIVGPPFYWLAAGMFFGALFFALSLFHKFGIDHVFGLFGLIAAVVCFWVKTSIERRNRARLEDNQRRLGLLTKQLEQAQEEAKKLDDKFPPAPNQASATLDSRLQKAKLDLSFFEGLVPVEEQWREATRRSRALEGLRKKAETSYKASKKRWREWLRGAYLPTTLKPSQVRDLLARAGIADDLRREAEAVRSEIEYLGRERQGISDRFDVALQLVGKFGIVEKAPTLLVAKLRGLLEERSNSLTNRAKLLEEMIEFKKECRKALALRRRQVRELRRFLSSLGVKSREELLAAVERRELYVKRRAELDAIQHRLAAGIEAALLGEEVDPEEELRALLDDAEVRADLPIAVENLVKRIESFDAELKGKLELSGRLGQRADALAAKKDSIRQRFNAVAADLRLAKMAELWQSRSVSEHVMEDIRRAYEKERQPETLREASRFLKTLTDGMYVNIWTPLGEDALFVDASNGETLDVAALSRGTRELLFIAIRLALVVSFEKHGVQMPLIWDDVLVNFDYKRAAIAAKLLVDFAKAGRQIFLFTCHEHICRLFLRLGVPVRVLPSQTDPARRRFRVLTPIKKSTTEVTVDVERLDENEPNFVEQADETSAYAYAIDAPPAEPGVEAVENVEYNESFEYKLSDDGSRATDSLAETSASVFERVSASAEVRPTESLDVDLVEPNELEFRVEPKASEEEPSVVGVAPEEFVYESGASEISTDFSSREAATVDGSVSSSSIKVVSNSSSSVSGDSGEDVAEISVVDSPDSQIESDFDEEEDADYVSVDPDADFDEDGGWSSVVDGLKDDSRFEIAKPFNEFMTSDSDDEEEEEEEDLEDSEEDEEEELEEEELEEEGDEESEE